MKFFQQIGLVLLLATLAGCATTDSGALPPTASGHEPTGKAQAEVWENISGGQLPTLYSAPDYPDAPTRNVEISRLEYKAAIANHGVRVRAYIYPPEDGEYLFKLYGTKTAELWVSKSELSNDKVKLVQLPSPEGSTAEAKWKVKLEAEKRYYIEILQSGTTKYESFTARWIIPSKGYWTKINEISPYVPELEPELDEEFIAAYKMGYQEGYGDSAEGLDFDDDYPPMDTDGDGVPDKWELMFGYDPNDYYDMGYDDDQDGLTGYEEYSFGTSPLNADSNGDGKLDGQHVADGTDPTAGGDSPILPTDPVDPTEPVDPTDPTEPVDPPSEEEASMLVSWVTPTTRIDGSDLRPDEIKEFVIRYGTSEDTLTNDVTVPDPAATSHTIKELTPGTYYISITVYDIEGNSSVASNVKMLQAE
ncbi:PA14 domain-containing protein [Corallincola holothuriorum]|nr:PA14 domain-containing protein [Corallincola holothuriorum]